MTLPSGTVTFLFTDIEQSTRLWEEQPGWMQRALARHDKLLRSLIEQHGGYVFKTVGDAFCAAFSTPSAAVAAALAVQRALNTDLELSSGAGALRVRIALHTGAAEERNGDYFGPPLNRVARLLAAAPRVKVLVTSRVPLHLRGEQEYPVPPLELPDARYLPPVERLTQYEAVRLFIERAQGIKPDFAVTNENAPAVAEICHRLDGLPLAIELVAARIRILPPAMLARLESRLKLLTGGARDLPARQQTLRGAIEWSYELLGEEEKVLFRRLAVFAGGCTLEAVERVCNGAGDFELDALDGLASLAEKSLLKQEEGSGGEPRFVMLETIHEYAHEKLQESAEAEELRSRHAAHFLALAAESAVQLRGPEQAIWYERLEREREDFRRALEWSHVVEADRAETGLRLAGALGVFWHARGSLREGSEWLERMLTRGANAEAEVRLQALHHASVLHYLQGNYAQAHLFAEENLHLARQHGESEKIARAYYAAGLARFAQEEYSTADALLAEGITHAEQIGEKAPLRALIHLRAEAARALHDFERARVLYQEALALAHELGLCRGPQAATGGCARRRAGGGRGRVLTQPLSPCYPGMPHVR